MLQPNEVLSKTMHVKPLKKGEVAIYQLIEAAKISPTHKTLDEKPLYNTPGWQGSKQSLVKDIETGQRVMIGNVVSIKPEKHMDGTTKYVDVTGPLKFVGGYLRCTEDDFNTYQYAERHNANQDNPFRDPSKPAKYFRVDPKKKAISDMNTMLILGEAIVWISECNDVEIKAINSELPDGLKLHMDNPFEVIKAELLNLTKEDPIMVMKASNNKLAIAKITVMEAEKYQIILWEDQSRKWFFNEEDQEDIVIVEIGKNRIDGLVAHFKTAEGQKTYKRIQTKLKKFLRIGAPE